MKEVYSLEVPPKAFLAECPCTQVMWKKEKKKEPHLTFFLTNCICLIATDPFQALSSGLYPGGLNRDKKKMRSEMR